MAQATNTSLSFDNYSREVLLKNSRLKLQQKQWQQRQLDARQSLELLLDSSSSISASSDVNQDGESTTTLDLGLSQSLASVGVLHLDYSQPLDSGTGDLGFTWRWNMADVLRPRQEEKRIYQAFLAWQAVALSEAKQRLLMQTWERFHQHVLLNEELRTSEERLSTSERLLSNQQMRFTQGYINKLDWLSLQLSHRELEDEVIRLRLDIQKNEIQLATLVDLSSFDRDLKGELKSEDDRLGKQIHFQKKHLLNNTAYMRLLYQELQLNLEQKRQRPIDPDLLWIADYQTSFSEDEDEYSGSVLVSIPFGKNGKIRTKREEQSLSLEELELEKNNAERDVFIAFENDRLELENLKLASRRQLFNHDLSKQRYEESLRLYSQGLLSTDDYLRDYNSFKQSQRRLLQTLYQSARQQYKFQLYYGKNE